MTRRVTPWLLAAALAAGALAAGWSLASGAPEASVRARQLAASIRCPDCESLSAADSHTSTARAIRRDVRARIAAGQRDEDIRRAYADRYGESILLDPPGDGIGFLVWGLPAVALVLGVVGLAAALRRWGAEPRLRATGADEALVDRARGRDDDGAGR